ncbi:hypothetical protein [Psychroflexus maritimus]|uniref:Uncharacterized protein n=1 Tax=Psychroflexus maritimus TaxID=2714865 RepID=A0A967E2Y1_9FLAO|nr:hypothetical protein [Psychroflexus maritimus]NGZ90169.1 hypothetical protein [Psychroflexus maritimus]
MKQSQQIFTVILLSFFTITNIHAQSLEDAMGGFEDNVNDVPIHMLVYLGLAIGGYLGINKLRK